MQYKQIKNDLMDALEANKPKTAPYDTEAQVVRVEGSTAWVHIPGGVDETPVAMTINAAAGDTVRVRVSGGTAWLVGNDTAPPTDDTLAKEAMDQLNVRWAKIGTAIVDTLRVGGVNADWINAGALVIYDDDGNEIFRADKTGKIFRWNMEKSSLGDDGQLLLKDNGTESDAAFEVESSTGLLDTARVTSYGFKYYKFGAAMGMGHDETSDADMIYWQKAARKIFEVLESSTGSGLTVNRKTLEEWIAQESGVAFKTGTITIPTSPGEAGITFNDIVPDGKTVYGVNLTIGSYPIPYINSSGNVVTWISHIENTGLTIKNNTTAWTNYNYYLTVFFH